MLSEEDKYFINEVELPYISFLKKLTFWSMINSSALEVHPVNIGFSLLNKIKEIMQLKNIFQRYSCYYSHHEYAFNLFEGCLINIQTLWKLVCQRIKRITLTSLKMNFIEEN